MAIKPVNSSFIDSFAKMLAPTPEEERDRIAMELQLERTVRGGVKLVQHVSKQVLACCGIGSKSEQLQTLEQDHEWCDQVEVPWDINPKADLKELHKRMAECTDYHKKLKLYESAALQDCTKSQTKLSERFAEFRKVGLLRGHVKELFWETCAAKRGLKATWLKIPGNHSSEQVRIYDASNAVRKWNGEIQGIEKARLIKDKRTPSEELCFQNMVHTDQFFREAFQTELLPLQAYLHIKNGSEAWWKYDMNSACFGQVFRPTQEFFQFSDVVAHEFTHGLIDHTCGLTYQDESGALNESLADVFGIMAKHYLEKEKRANEADWLFGNGIEGSRTYLRSFGISANQSLLGKYSFLPTNMNDYYFYPKNRDCGGVHTNSSIPNSAFFRAAKADGGSTWKKMGQIWFRAMIVTEFNDGFGEFALNTMKAAKPFGDGVVNMVAKAWNAVGVLNSKNLTYQKVRRLRDS